MRSFVHWRLLGYKKLGTFSCYCITGNISLFFRPFPVSSTAVQIPSSAFPPADESHGSCLHHFVPPFSKLPAVFTLCAALSIISSRSGAAAKMEAGGQGGRGWGFPLLSPARTSADSTLQPPAVWTAVWFNSDQFIFGVGSCPDRKSVHPMGHGCCGRENFVFRQVVTQ